MTDSAVDRNVDESGLNQADPVAVSTPCSDRPIAAPPITTPQNGKSRGGAPAGNSNRTKSALRRAGSNLPKGCGHVGRKVRGLVEAAAEAWHYKYGPGPMPLAAAFLIDKRIRRAEERDRLAAKQLADGKDLKGEPLTFDRQLKLQDAQEAAGRVIEDCLTKLGLSLDDSPASSPSNTHAALLAELRNSERAAQTPEQSP